MASYQSKFSGVEIDRAVAYFNAIDKAGRTILTLGISQGTGTNGWTASSTPDDIAHAKYYVEITASDLFDIVGSNFNKPPEVYFVQNGTYVGTYTGGGTYTVGYDGQKWDIDYLFVRVSGSITKIKCYSNLPLAGTVVIVSVLSTPSSGTVIDGDLSVNGNITMSGVIVQS